MHYERERFIFGDIAHTQIYSDITTMYGQKFTPWYLLLALGRTCCFFFNFHFTIFICHNFSLNISFFVKVFLNLLCFSHFNIVKIFFFMSIPTIFFSKRTCSICSTSTNWYSFFMIILFFLCFMKSHWKLNFFHKFCIYILKTCLWNFPHA